MTYALGQNNGKRFLTIGLLCRRMGKNGRTLLSMSTLFLIILLYAFYVLDVSAISNPNYLTHPELTPTLITLTDNRLAVYDPAESKLLFISKEGSGTIREFKLSQEVVDLTSLNDKILMISSVTSKLYVYSLSRENIEEIELIGIPSDLDVSPNYVAVSIPDERMIIILDPANLKEISRIQVDVDRGLGKISIDRNLLYVVLADGYTVEKIDLKSNEKQSIKIDERIQRLKAYNGKVLIASSEDKLYLISEALKIEKTWSLERGSTVDIGLYILSDGRIIYVARARWVIGEIEGDKINEVRVGGRIFSEVLDVDRLWFTEINTRKIGWVWFSRPPIIESLVIEPKEAGSFKASAKIVDPDNEPIRATLIVTVKSKIPYLPGENRTYNMDHLPGQDLYISEFSLKSGEEAEVYVVAFDPVNNIGVSEKIPIQYKEEETKTMITTSPQPVTPPPIELSDIYLTASSLLLLIPIIAAIIIMKTKRKTRKKRK